MDADEQGELRALLMGDAKLREGSASVCEAMLLELDGCDDDEDAPEWIPPDDGETLSVGEVRERLRWTLAEIAAKT